MSSYNELKKPVTIGNQHKDFERFYKTYGDEGKLRKKEISISDVDADLYSVKERIKNMEGGMKNNPHLMGDDAFRIACENLQALSQPVPKPGHVHLLFNSLKGFLSMR